MNSKNAHSICEIKLGDFGIKPVGKVLKATTYITLSEGQELISSAKSECHEMVRRASEKSSGILQKAKKEAAEIIEKAKSEKQEEKKRGYTEGFEQGKKDVSGVMMDFVNKSAESFVKLENDVVEIVKMALRKIIGKIDSHELIVKVAKNALQRVKMQKQVTLRVAPSEAQTLRDKVDELIKDTPLIEFLDVYSDAHLSPGSCVLETELGVIDAGIAVQLEAIENALSKSKA